MRPMFWLHNALIMRFIMRVANLLSVSQAYGIYAAQLYSQACRKYVAASSPQAKNACRMKAWKKAIADMGSRARNQGIGSSGIRNCENLHEEGERSSAVTCVVWLWFWRDWCRWKDITASFPMTPVPSKSEPYCASYRAQTFAFFMQVFTIYDSRTSDSLISSWWWVPPSRIPRGMLRSHTPVARCPPLLSCWSSSACRKYVSAGTTS